MKICPTCNNRFDEPGWCCMACGWMPGSQGGFAMLAPALAREGGGFKPEYFAELATLEAGNFWFQSRNALIVHALERHIPHLRSFLEIGCGTGFVLSGIAVNFPDTTLTGSEIFSAGLSYAAKRVPKAEFVQMDARCIPFESHFDAVGAFDVLEHIAEDEAVLAQIRRSIKPGGVIVLTVPQHPWLWSTQDEMACHVRRYTAKELQRKVEGAGFAVLWETSFVSLLLPMMWLSRRFGRRKQAQAFDTLAELKIGDIPNYLFRAVMNIERFMLAWGMRFPVGGSRLLIARKV